MIDEDGATQRATGKADEMSETQMSEGRTDAGSADPGPGTESTDQLRSDPTTGDPRVDAVLESLERLKDLPVGAHAEVYEAIHTQLREVLADAGDEHREHGENGPA